MLWIFKNCPVWPTIFRQTIFTIDPSKVAWSILGSVFEFFFVVWLFAFTISALRCSTPWSVEIFDWPWPTWHRPWFPGSHCSSPLRTQRFPVTSRVCCRGLRLLPSLVTLVESWRLVDPQVWHMFGYFYRSAMKLLDWLRNHINLWYVKKYVLCGL